MSARLAVVFLAIGALACETPSREPAPPVGASLSTGLLVATSVTAEADETPVAARLERLRLEAGTWLREPLDDPESLVFHHARAWDPPGPLPLSIVTLGGTSATVKL